MGKLLQEGHDIAQKTQKTHKCKKEGSTNTETEVISGEIKFLEAKFHFLFSYPHTFHLLVSEQNYYPPDVL